jgi:hypothetical protein
MGGMGVWFTPHAQSTTLTYIYIYIYIYLYLALSLYTLFSDLFWGAVCFGLEGKADMSHVRTRPQVVLTPKL